MHSSLPQQLGNFGFLSHRPVVKLFEFLERSTIKTCDAVITISSDLKDRVIETKPTAKQLMIENLALQIVFPDTRKLTVSALKAKLGINGKLPIVYTGNFERYQGVELLFESAEIVKRHHSEILFVFVGGKPQEVERWRNEVRRKKLDDYALFVGSVSLEESLTYLDMAEILVSPRTGGTSVPLKIYTYLVSGKAMVATNLISHTQVLNEDIAVLVQPTKEAMADGIVRLIRDPNLRLQLGLNAREFAHQKYNQDNYVAKLEQIYQALQVPECAPKQRVTSLNGH
jgi:glycosyltransferase involved in cell wall biosynthesis